MRLVRWIPGGELLPRGYGVAWHRYDTDEDLCLPIGLNALCGIVRRLYITLRFGLGSPTDHHAYIAGLRKGRDESRRSIERLSRNVSQARHHEELQRITREYGL